MAFGVFTQTNIGGNYDFQYIPQDIVGEQFRGRLLWSRMTSWYRSACLIGAGVAFPGIAAAQDTDDEAIEEIVVKGFRGSLQAAVSLKRNAVNNRDSIVSEDIGKMPDLNLAEAIQRVPGVSITREGGEGRQITVRGLSPSFTRVTLNGMEVPASAGGLDSFGGVNRGRGFASTSTSPRQRRSRKAVSPVRSSFTRRGPWIIRERMSRFMGRPATTTSQRSTTRK